MNRSKQPTALLVAAIVVGTPGFAGPAYAGAERGSATTGTAPAADAGATIKRAIIAAERHVGGEAIGTGSEVQDGTVSFYVDVLKDGLRRTVIVDLRSGLVAEAARMNSGGI